MNSIFADMQNKHIHLVGIKGTGVCALAELLLSAGAILEGSDTSEKFYTDAILKELGIPYCEDFSQVQLHPECALLIHSAAYTAETNPVLQEAQRRGIPVIKYSEALGAFSREHVSAAVAGVHGKTTTTALAGSVVKALGLAARVLVGSQVADFDNRCTLSLGDRYFIAETCEYRHHFMSFRPQVILITSVESDHQDYFPTYESIRDAFVDFALLLPAGGGLVYCADDEGAVEVATAVQAKRRDISLIPYGFKASGPWQILWAREGDGENEFALSDGEELKLRLPGRHTVLDAVGALALIHRLIGKKTGFSQAEAISIKKALLEFKGSKRRSEIVGMAGDVLIMDDYGHHPRAIASTLAGYRRFYKGRRIVLSFMSHTYTRTAALLEEFAHCFKDADLLILHKIYASAREKPPEGFDGKSLFEAVQRQHPQVYYYEEVADALPFLREELRDGDLFVTMGAGDNWHLGLSVLNALKKKEGQDA